MVMMSVVRENSIDIPGKSDLDELDDGRFKSYKSRVQGWLEALSASPCAFAVSAR